MSRTQLDPFVAAATRARAGLLLRLRAAAGQPPPRSGRELWMACCAGDEPAELLDPRDREDLVAHLLDRCWSITEIATHTRETEYTIDRIVRRIHGEHV